METAKAVMNGVMQLGIVRGVIAADPAPFSDGPKVADVSVVDRGNRHLPDLTFSFRLSGGIKTVDVQGTVSV